MWEKTPSLRRWKIKALRLKIALMQKSPWSSSTCLPKNLSHQLWTGKKHRASPIGKKHADNFIIDQDHSEEPVGKEEEEEIFIKGISSVESSSAASTEEKEKEAPQQAPAREQEEKEEQLTSSPKLKGIKVVGKIDLEGKKEAVQEEKKEPEAPVAEKAEEVPAKAEQGRPRSAGYPGS